MATFSVRQVPPQSVDTAGVSIATTTLDTLDPRPGQVYNPTSLAAGEPVWFHPLTDNRFVALFSRRLHTATLASPQPGGPLVYSAATETTTPCWAVIDPASGVMTGLADIPTETEGVRVLSAAASRGNYLFVLSRIGDEALLQHFRVGTGQAMILQGEEIVPGGLGLGLYIERNDLWVFGPTDGKLTLARKNWGRIGQVDSPNPFLRWRYRTTRGWSFDVDDLAPVGGDIPTSGPVSVARHRMRYYLVMPVYTPPVAAVPATATKPAVPAVPGHWDAKTWTSRLIDSRWAPHPFTVPLGGDTTYLGGTAYLQPQLALTAGQTSTPTTRGVTVLDDASDAVQVFTGLASQVVTLPGSVRTTLPGYTLYNQTPSSDVTVQTVTGEFVSIIRRGQALTLTPTVIDPLATTDWTPSTPAARTPTRRVGFPYVASTGLRTAAGHRTLVTSWGVFGV
jgi:hypothetical protein